MTRRHIIGDFNRCVLMHRHFRDVWALVLNLRASVTSTVLQGALRIELSGCRRRRTALIPARPELRHDRR